MDRSGNRKRIVFVGRKDIRESLRTKRTRSSMQLISHPTRLNLLPERPTQPAFGMSQPANKYKRSTTRKSVALIGGEKKREGFQAFDLAFRYCDPVNVDLLLLIKVCTARVQTWLLPSRSFYLGYRPVHGWGTCRCGSTRRRPHRYDKIQIAMLFGSDKCITRRCRENTTTNLSSRHICIFSSESHAWRTVTITVPYNCSSVCNSRCNTIWDPNSLPSHW